MDEVAIPDDLRDRLSKGRVIPFVGAGVSMAVRDKVSKSPLFPSWFGLLNRAADLLEEQEKVQDSILVRALLGTSEPDYLESARRAKNALGSQWIDFLKGQLNPERERADEDSLDLAKSVWSVGSKLVVTTNFDKVLEWSCPSPEELKIWKIEAPNEQGQMLRNGVSQPTVWQLHGTIDDAGSIILTRDGYSFLYSDNTNQNARYGAALLALRILLATHTFVFVGFSLNDPFFGAQLQMIHNLYQKDVMHYVLVHRSELAWIEGLDLPVNPIVFDDYGAPLIRILAGLGRIAAHAIDWPDIPGDDRKDMVAIMELAAILLREGHDSDFILSSLRAIRESATDQLMQQEASRVAAEYQRNLQQKRTILADQREILAESISHNERMKAELRQKQELLAKASKETARRIQSYVDSQLNQALSNVLALTEAKFSENLPANKHEAAGGSLMSREIAEDTSKMLVQLVELKVRECLRRCQEEIVRPEIANLVELAQNEIGINQIYSLNFRLDHSPNMPTVANRELSAGAVGALMVINLDFIEKLFLCYDFFVRHFGFRANKRNVKQDYLKMWRSKIDLQRERIRQVLFQHIDVSFAHFNDSIGQSLSERKNRLSLEADAISRELSETQADQEVVDRALKDVTSISSTLAKYSK